MKHVMAVALLLSACADRAEAPPGTTTADAAETAKGDEGHDVGPNADASDAAPSDDADAAPPDLAVDTADVASDTVAVAPGPRLVPPPAIVEEPARWAAFGDVHGDLAATRRALRMAGAIDDADHWIGGDLVVIQVGDELDRGDQEQAIIDLMERLADEAHQAGGEVYALLGNHETMNVDEDYRYVTDGGWRDFDDTPFEPDDPRLAGYEPRQRGRVAAFLPGGPYARVLAGRNVAMKIGDTLFVHGGLLPQHATMGLAAIDDAVSAWMRGDGPRPSLITDDDSPVWIRNYSDAPDAIDCAELAETLAAFDATRMVVAHTVQPAGITSACEEQVWRVDVGLSSYYGGQTEVLLHDADGRFSVAR